MKRFFRAFIAATVVLYASAAVRADLQIQFDYTYDTNNFFSGPNVGRRSLLTAAANVLLARISKSHNSAIIPGGGNTWSLTFPNPATGASVTLTNPTTSADIITFRVGARDLPGSLIGFSQYQYSYFGDGGWQGLFQGKDSTTHFESFGGSIAFDSLTSWYFDADPSTLESFPSQYDFLSVAEHEMGHLLGFTAGAQAFNAKISGNNFTGAHAVALYGAPVPLASSSDHDHWKQGIISNFDGREVTMDPTFFFNSRKNFSELDFAALADIGYTVAPEPSSGCLILCAAGILLAKRP